MANKSKKTLHPADLGPAERLQHGAHRLEKTRTGVRLRNIDGSALDALFYRDLIGQDEHIAGSRLMADCLLARMMGPPGFNPESSTRSQYSNIPDTVAQAIDRINAAMAHVAHKCGRGGESLLIHLLTRDAIPDDTTVLRQSLTALAEHYCTIRRTRRKYVFEL